MAANSSWHPIKWRLSFKSRSSRYVVQLVDLNPSAPFAESIKALESACPENSQPWDTRLLHLLCDMVIQDAIVSEVGLSNYLAPRSRVNIFRRSIVPTWRTTVAFARSSSSPAPWSQSSHKRGSSHVLLQIPRGSGRNTANSTPLRRPHALQDQTITLFMYVSSPGKYA